MQESVKNLVSLQSSTAAHIIAVELMRLDVDMISGGYDQCFLFENAKTANFNERRSVGSGVARNTFGLMPSLWSEPIQMASPSSALSKTIPHEFRGRQHRVLAAPKLFRPPPLSHMLLEHIERTSFRTEMVIWHSGGQTTITTNTPRSQNLQ
jgi:hypothetical protein